MKKLLSLMLALMMLAIPALGAAESTMLYGSTWAADDQAVMQNALDAGRRVNYTVSFSDLGKGLVPDADVEGIVNDVLGALKFTGYQQGDETGFAMNLSGNDVLTFAVAQSGDDTYLSSNLLGGTVVVSASNAMVLVNRLLDMFVLMGALEEDAVAEMKAALPELVETIKAEFDNAMNSQLANLKPEDLNFTALTTAVLPILVSAEKSEVTMQPRNCDPADTMITCTITPDNFKALVKAVIQFVLDNPVLLNYYETQMRSAGAFGTGEVESVEDLFNKMLAELEGETLLAGNGELVLYTAGVPAELVHADLRLPMAMENDKTEDLIISFGRLTKDQSVCYNANLTAGEMTVSVDLEDGYDRFYMGMAMAENGQNVMQFGMTMTTVVADNAYDTDVRVDMALTDTDTSEEMNFTVLVKDKTTVNGVDFNEDAVFSILFNGQQVIDIMLNCSTADPGASIMTGNVTRPAELNDSDFANWFVGIVNGLQGWLGTLIMSLPESVLTLIMGG